MAQSLPSIIPKLCFSMIISETMFCKIEGVLFRIKDFIFFKSFLSCLKTPKLYSLGEKALLSNENKVENIEKKDITKNLHEVRNEVYFIFLFLMRNNLFEQRVCEVFLDILQSSSIFQ